MSLVLLSESHTHGRRDSRASSPSASTERSMRGVCTDLHLRTTSICVRSPSCAPASPLPFALDEVALSPLLTLLRDSGSSSIAPGPLPEVELLRDMADGGRAILEAGGSIRPVLLGPLATFPVLDRDILGAPLDVVDDAVRLVDMTTEESRVRCNGGVGAEGSSSNKVGRRPP